MGNVQALLQSDDNRSILEIKHVTGMELKQSLLAFCRKWSDAAQTCIRHAPLKSPHFKSITLKTFRKSLQALSAETNKQANKQTDTCANGTKSRDSKKNKKKLIVTGAYFPHVAATHKF